MDPGLSTDLTQIPVLAERFFISQNKEEKKLKWLLSDSGRKKKPAAIDLAGVTERGE